MRHGLAGALFVAVLALAASGAAQTPPPAGVTITTDISNCAEAISVQVWADLGVVAGVAPPGPSESVTLRTNLSDNGGYLTFGFSFITGERITPGACSWTFRDLAPGRYAAVLVGSHGSRGAAAFSFAAGEEAKTVPIAPPAVALSGRVLKAGAPMARTHIKVESLRNHRPPVSIVSDDAGHYQVTLDRPDRYRFEIYGVGSMEAEVRAGATTLDLTSIR